MMDIQTMFREYESELADVFERIEDIEERNTVKVLNALREEGISYRHFAQTTGYGYDDIGRDTLCRIYAHVFGTEKAIVRPQIASGTHALGLAMQGVLRPGDTLLCASGKPYDTLEEVIGLSGKKGNGSLMEYGIRYKEIGLLEGGKLDIDTIEKALRDDTSIRLVHIQRSRGYAWRPALQVKDINKVIELVHGISERAFVMVDNCYGEFTGIEEPCADLLCGSMIKNPGGGLAPTGGYIAGKEELVELVGYRMTTPGIGDEVGSYAASYRSFYQGLFMAPHTVAQALKTAVLAAKVFTDFGLKVEPTAVAERNDIIQAIRFEDEDKLIRFIQLIQKYSPVDSDAIPEPWPMPGYQDNVIMAAGTFVAGSSIELSADAPIRPPYIAYMQGSLTYAHGKYVLKKIIEELY